MHFQFGQYEIDTDVNKNREIYKKLPLVSEGCKCDGCINYQEAIFAAPKEVILFFDSLGIDIQKPCEIYVNCSENEGRKLFYGGFYHLTGEVINGRSAWIPDDNNSGAAWWDGSQTFKIADGFKASFQSGCALLEKEFTEPAIQMEVEFHVPWVLKKENKYR